MKALVFFLLLTFSGIANAQIWDMGDSSGVSKDSNGYNVYRNSSSASASNSAATLTLQEKISVPTSKGNFLFDLQRSVPVDLNRVGRAMRTFAVATGPVGLAVSTVDAICSLTNICNQAGEWLFKSAYDSLLYPSQTNSVESYCTGGSCSGQYDTRAPTAAASCKKAAEEVKLWGADRKGEAVSDSQCWVTVKSTGQYLLSSGISKVPGCPPLYVQSGTVCVFTQSNQDRPATSSDWDSKESLLNDQRFIDPLLNGQQPVPVGNPQVVTPQKIQIGQQTTTTKDGAGNTTGTQTKTDEIEISQPTAAENPTNSPSAIKITESSTTTNYNTSNQITNSTTTVTNNSNPVATSQQPITITIDDVPDVPLQTVAVPGTFSFSTWGSGSCPASKTWVTMFGTHEFSYQLTCDFATTAKPIILLIAAIVSFMIVASIRTE